MPIGTTFSKNELRPSFKANAWQERLSALGHLFLTIATQD